MPKDVEDTLNKVEHIFLWDGKKARIGHETMILDIADGGKRILDITARNEAIDLWNLQSYLVQGPERALWCYFVDYIFVKFLEASYLDVRPGQIFSYMTYMSQSLRAPLYQKKLNGWYTLPENTT
jgi:hypothetical protein